MPTPLDYIARALFQAARGRGQTSPNPLVGAVVVSVDGVVVGQGFHRRAGEPHAEVHALRAAGEKARGGTLYCTLEPCCHVGRTGPCVPLIVESGIARVVASVEDPNPLVSGRGFALLRERGVSVEVGPGAAEAMELNRSFFTLLRKRRPFVVLKAALSQDHAIAERLGQRTVLTARQANRHAHRLRAEVDALGVGVGTITSDDPLLTARGPYRERPLIRVIFDRQLTTPPGARVLSTREAGPVIIVTTAQAARLPRARELERAGADLEIAAADTLASALSRLGGRQVGSLLLEGGASIYRAAWDEGLVDYVTLYMTPHVLGERAVRFLDGRSSVAELTEGATVTRLGPDTLMERHVHRSD